MNGKIPFAVLFALALAGCAASPPPRTDVQASDQGAFVPALRLSMGIGGTPAAPSEAQSGVAVEFSASRSSGSGSQSLASGAAPVEYNGQIFAAPQTLQHDFDLALYDVSGRWRHFSPGSALGFELLFGVAYAELDLAVSGSSGRVTGTESAFGPVLGAGLLWRLRSSTSVHGRVTAYTAFEPDEGGVRLELALVQSLGRNASVRAGYAYTRLEFDQDPASTMQVRTSGPMLGLELHF